MNIIMCATGTAINLDNVCFAKKSMSEGRHLVRFTFVGDVALELIFDTEMAADDQFNDYVEACKQAQERADK